MFSLSSGDRLKTFSEIPGSGRNLVSISILNLSSAGVVNTVFVYGYAFQEHSLTVRESELLLGVVLSAFATFWQYSFNHAGQVFLYIINFLCILSAATRAVCIRFVSYYLYTTIFPLAFFFRLFHDHIQLLKAITALIRTLNCYLCALILLDLHRHRDAELFYCHHLDN